MAGTMAEATLAHLFRLHTAPAPALSLSLVVAFLRRDQILRFLGAQR